MNKNKLFDEKVVKISNDTLLKDPNYKLEQQKLAAMQKRKNTVVKFLLSAIIYNN